MSTRISTNYHRHHHDSQNRTVRRSSTMSHKRTLGPDHSVPNSSRRIHSLQQSRTSNKFQEHDVTYGSPRHHHYYTDTPTTSLQPKDTSKQTRPRPRRLSTPDLTDTLTNSRSDSDSELNSPTYRQNSRSSPQLSIPGAWPASPIAYTAEPDEITVDGLNDEFDYVILRVPAKSRASSIASFSSSARRSLDSSRRGSFEEDMMEKSVSRLSTPEATHLVQSIKALKTPVADQTKQFAMYSPDRSTSWRVDDMGKYEYLVLRSSSQMSTARPRMSSEESDKITYESDQDDEVESLHIANPGFPLDDIADQWHDPPQSFSTYQRSSSYTEITASLFAYKPEEIRGSSPYQIKNLSTTVLEVPQRPRSRSLSELRQYPTQSPSEPSHLDQIPPVPEHRTISATLKRSSSSGSQKLTRLLSTVSRRSLQTLRISSATEIGNQMEQVWERRMEQVASIEPQHGLTRKYTLSRPSFWDPNHHVPDAALHHVSKPSIGFKILSIFRPRKMRVRSLMRQQHLLERGWAVERARSPCIAYMQDMGIHMGRLNPFAIINNTWEKGEPGSHLSFRETDFNQIDTYARSVRQSGTAVTPEQLATKYIVRPYRRDIQKVRAIFIWIIENIRMGAPQDGTSNSSNGSKSHGSDNENDGSIGGFGTSTHAEQVEKDWVETAEVVLSKRWCRTGVGFARLFCEMAVAAGLDDTKVVYGYLRVPKDNIEIATRSNGKIKINHAWCAVKIDGTYRLIDCYLASPFLPSNKGYIESHWFLARPLTMIYTHFPASIQDQFLDPPVTSAVFFALPHVRTPFFRHHLQVLDYEFTFLDLVDDDVLHMTLWMDDATGCYAEVECRLQKTGSTTSAIIIKRALAQFIMDGHQRVCKIKAVLPSDMRVGWLKIYAGPKIWPDSQTANSAFNPYPLAMVYRITHSGRPPQVFDFVKLHLSVYDFYVHEPQCYVLYPMQMYTFRILSMVNRHQKLAVKSPTGRLNRLVYFPQDKSYTGSMIVGEVGIWHLVCLQESGSWNNVVASWECRS